MDYFKFIQRAYRLTGPVRWRTSTTLSRRQRCRVRRHTRRLLAQADRWYFTHIERRQHAW